LQAVVDHLSKRTSGFAPTIAGHGKSVDKNVNHAQCTQSIVDYISDLTDIVLLGHSFAGTIIAKVAEAIRIHSTTHLLRCFVLNDGESLRDSLPPHIKRY